MVEKLTIKNFGPIKDVSLDLRAVNIFIGGQGTGKSTVTKLLAVAKRFEQLSDGAIYDFSDVGVKEEESSYTKEGNWHLDAEHQKSFIQAMKEYDFGTEELKSDTVIEFQLKESRVARYENNRFGIKEISSDTVGVRANTSFSYDSIFIPAYREAAVILQDNLYALMRIDAALPKILSQFGDRWVKGKKRRTSFDFSEVFDVKYSYNKRDKDFVTLSNGLEIPIEKASSAINSGVPLLVVFEGAIGRDANADSDDYYPYIIIEEPELNCFPPTQRKMMQFFVRKIKHNEKPDCFYNRLFITTHSPYMLTSLNNLIYAYEAGKKHEKEVNDIIDKKYWMNPNEVSAYMMLPDGTCEDIMDREENLIKADKIDGVSSIINEEFNRIIDIELGVQHEKD
jgi:predicted ATP-dependent endonuclease of OLD family